MKLSKSFYKDNLLALAFENVKKAINYGLVSGQNAKLDPITSIVDEKY